MSARIQLVHEGSKPRVQLAPETVEEIENALALFRSYEALPFTEHGAKSFQLAICFLNKYIDGNPTSPHRSYVDHLVMTNTGRLLRNLTLPNKLVADISVVALYLCLLTKTVRTQARALMSRDPELEEVVGKFLDTWIEPMADAWVEQVASRRRSAAAKRRGANRGGFFH